MERGDIRKWAEHREKERLKRKLSTYTCAHYYQYRHVIKFQFRLQEIEEVRISNEYLSNLLDTLVHKSNTYKCANPARVSGSSKCPALMCTAPASTSVSGSETKRACKLFGNKMLL